jgi:hypothetical protein
MPALYLEVSTKKSPKHLCFQPVDNRFRRNGSTRQQGWRDCCSESLPATSAKPSANFTISLLCFFAPCQGAMRQNGRMGPGMGRKPKMAWRQTETTYLRAILIWLQGYWAE